MKTLQWIVSSFKPKKIKPISIDQLTYQLNSGIFNIIPDDVLLLILIACDQNTLLQLNLLNKRFYYNVNQTKTRLFVENLDRYRGNKFKFDVESQQDIVSHLIHMPASIDELFTKNKTCTNKQSTIMTIALQLAEMMVYLTTNGILKLSLTRKIDIRLLTNRTNAPPTICREPIKSFMCADDVETVKTRYLPKGKEENFDCALEKILYLLKNAAFDQKNILAINTRFFNTSLTKRQSKLLSAIKQSILKLEHELNQLSLTNTKIIS